MKIIYVISTLLCLNVRLAGSSNIGADRQDITLNSQGGYGNILIAVDEAVPEDRKIITNLQTYFTQASEFLLRSTRGEMYFESFAILIPSTWSSKDVQGEPTDESVHRARVIVGEPNSYWGDEPYTLQPGQCGKEGDYIHLTPNYLTNIANNNSTKPEKRLVREFAHLKWGLFSEDVPITDAVSPHYYIKDNQIFPTICTESGYYGKYKDETNKDNTCILNQMGAVNSSCRFIPSTATANASIMSGEQFDSVVEFCSSDDEAIKHNVDAPNRQNRFCNEQSAWDVLNSHPDFAFNHSSSRGNATVPAPTFTLIQTTTPHDDCPQDIVCLSLDVSLSMDVLDRITKMEVAVKKYIQYYLKIDSLVGIVAFSEHATVLTNMTQITDDTVRDSLAAAVPTVTSWGTSIGSGLLECINLQRVYTATNSGNVRIMLLSDGEQVNGLTVADVEEEILELGIIVDTIAYSFSADPVLSSLSKATGGYAYFTSDINTQTLNTALIQTIQRQCDIDALVLLVSEVVRLTNTSTTKSIYIDSTIGLDTTLVISYTSDVYVNVITSEVGQGIIIKKDADLRTISVLLVGQGNGLVTYIITKVYDTPTEYVTIAITSNPGPRVQPIRTDNIFSTTDISPFNSSAQLVAYLRVFQGLTPVTGLTVRGHVEAKNSQNEMLYNDRGLGNDSTPNDGVYTAVFFAHQFSGDGYYSLRVDIFGDGFIAPSTNTNNRNKREVDISSGNITRTSSAGLLIVDGWFNVGDLVAPEKIKDLRMVGASSNGTEVYTLQWTAPGNDLNIGKVSGYEIGVSSNISLTNLKLLPSEALLTNVSNLLVEAGQTVELQIDVDRIDSNLSGFEEFANISTYYFRIRTFDDANPPNQAEWSNPVSVSSVDPDFFISTLPMVSTTAETIISTAAKTIISTAAKTNNLPIIIGVSVGVPVFIVVVALAILSVYFCKIKPHKTGKHEVDNPGDFTNPCFEEHLAGKDSHHNVVEL